jgi:uncharacterized protein (DUF427 family)
MSLTTGAGPLAPEPALGNYAIDGPAHRILFEPVGRRIRLELGGETVVDTEDARLLHETAIRPRLYVPLADVRDGVLRPSATRSHCPFKGDATYRSVDVGGVCAEDALWLYDQPRPEASWLRGYAGVYEDRFDRLLDEDEPVLGHLPDPYHRVELRSSSRHVVVTGPDDRLLAETRRPLLLAETGAPKRLLVPREDVVAELERGERVTVSPYTGVATHWTVGGVPDGAVTYEQPPAASARLEGYVAFEGAGIAVREVRAPESSAPPA